MVELDVVGLSCPEPLIRLKPLLDKNEKEIKITCNYGSASDNIKRIAINAHYKVEAHNNNDGTLTYFLTKQ